jgi:flagellar hook-associated protein 2
MGILQVGGLATGLDTNTIISQLLAVEQKPVTALQTQKLQLQAVSTAFNDLQSKLVSLKTQADNLATPATVFPRSVSSSTDSVATATASPGADHGTFSLTVSALARGSIATAVTTKGAQTDTIATGAGTFQFKLGASGTVASVPVDGTTTLAQLVKAINDKNAGVKAGVVNVGTSASPAYKLTLTSTASGAANNIVVVADGTSLGVANTQTGLDAAFTIAGIGSFTRATNTFSDVLDGVTITLKASSGSTDLSVVLDASGTQAKVQALLDSYNSVVQTINSQSQIQTSSTGAVQNGAFTGDATPALIRRSLAAAIATNVGGSLGTLSRLGITTQKDGTLVLDAAKLQTALTNDPQSVSDLLAGTSSRDGIADLLSARVATFTQTVSGTLAAKQASLDSQIARLGKDIDSAQARLTVTESTLRAKFANLEQVVSQIQSTGNALVTQLTNLAARQAAQTLNK